MRWRWRNRSFDSPAPTMSKPTCKPSKDASTRSRGFTPSCLLSSWQGAEITSWSIRNSRRIPMSDQIRLSGAEVQLLPATAQTLALALHELVTNSAKYGALFHAFRTIVHSLEDRDDILKIVWEETGGSAVRGTDVARVRNAKPDCQHRIAARRPGRVRLAPRRPDLPALRSAEAARCAATSRPSPTRVGRQHRASFGVRDGLDYLRGLAQTCLPC